MSAIEDCEAIEKGLKDIIFGMSSGDSVLSKDLNLAPKLASNSFSIDSRCLASNVEKAARLQQNTIRLPFQKLNAGDMLLNQTNSSELIDLNALTEFSAKHIDDPSFKTAIKEVKLPHPDLEDDCHIESSDREQTSGVSVLFKKIQNSPNFVNLPENPLQHLPLGSPKTQSIGKDSEPKSSPSHRRKDSASKRRKKRKKEKPGKNKNGLNISENRESLRDAVKSDVKVLAKDASKEVNCIKAKKSAFSSIGKEYSVFLEKQSYKFLCHICNFNTEVKDTANRHLTSKSHLSQKELNDKDMMLPFLPEFMPAQIEAITELLIYKTEIEGMQKSDVKLRNALGLKLKKFVEDNVLNPICSLELIGSSAYGIGLKSCEVDFIVKVSSDDIVPDALEAIYTALNKDDAYEKVVADFKQKRPQIRFRDCDTALICNILIDNSSSWKLGKLLSTYCNLDNRVQILGAAVRYWAKLCKIDQQDHGTMPSFSFALILVHFLQQVQPPVLPVLNEEKDFTGTPEFFVQYITENRWKSQNTDSVGELWLKFFKFYTFEYKIGESVVCIRTSKRTSCSERNWTTKFYAIEEPFLRRNIGYVIPSYQVCQFIQNSFLRTYRYFAYPQVKKEPIRLLKTDDFDALKLSEYALQKPILKEGESIDSDASENENENSTSPELLNISQDLEDHDPDIAVEDFLSTITNLSLEEQISDNKNENTSKLTGALQPESTFNESIIEDNSPEEKQSDNIHKENQSRSLNKLYKQTPICYWDTEGKEISKELFIYKFDVVDVNVDKEIPLTCSSCKKNGHRKKDCPIEELPTPRPLPEMTQGFLSSINDALYYIWESNYVTDEHFKEVEADMLDIENYIKDEFPDAKLSLFGSFCNGFGFRRVTAARCIKSDMDFCLTFNDNDDGKEIDSTNVINKVAAQLCKHPKLENIIPITSAKVPIVKFTWRETHVEGDISLYNTLALNNTEMLQLYSKIDKRVQVLGYALKHFAKILGICDASKGSLSSYAYILMVLYFLQQREPPVIPVLQELYNGDKPTKLIDDWNVWFYKDISKLKEVWPAYGKNDESVGQLWIGLLNFYSCDFDWKEYVISIKQKSPLRRFKKLWISDELAIEDPFDLSHNLGGGLSKKMNTYILKAFIRARERFGTPLPLDKMHTLYKKEVNYFFNRSYLNSGCEPPHDRGCGNCGKIGHLRKDCPQEKTCSYCRRPGHLIRNCPKKRNWLKERESSKDGNNFNYDSSNLDKRGNLEKQSQSLRMGPIQKQRHDYMRNFPGMHLQPLTVDRLEAQQKLLQMGVPTHRMPPPGFVGRTPTNPPPGFKTNAPIHQKSTNYPPAFNSTHAHVPPFPRQVNKVELRSQSPPKHYQSPPKNFSSNKAYHQMSQRGWPAGGRHSGLHVERHPISQHVDRHPIPQHVERHLQHVDRHPNPLHVERHPNPLHVERHPNHQLERSKRGHYQSRPHMSRDSHLVQHKSNQQQHTDHRHNRTNSDHLPYNSNQSDGWYTH